MKRNRKQNIRLLALILIILLGIGFAALAANLKIDGTVNVSKTSWDVHFENVAITEGSVTANPAPTSDDTTTTEMTYTINFTKPGDYFEFTTDIVNDGTIDAMVDVVSNNAYANASSTTPISLPTYLTSTVTYDDEVEIAQNQELLHNTREKIKVRVEFKKDIEISDLPSDGDTSIVFKFIGDYKQADENATTVGNEAYFATDSWDDIISAYKRGKTTQLQQDMEAGTTREVQLDLDNDGTPETTSHLRIANMNAPSECSTEGFSQTACGLVLEFADIITTHRMNPYSQSGTVDGDGNKGGWEHSEMRNYLNSTVYNALPQELKSRIVDTEVVSSHGSNDSSNFTTTDKLYLFSTKEIWGKEGTTSVINYDTAEAETRQLDYYHDIGLTTSSYSGAIKQYNGSEYYWWLRSAISDYYGSFYIVGDIGSWTVDSSNRPIGVSPAFRIG